jgi:hypothetical protein
MIAPQQTAFSFAIGGDMDPDVKEAEEAARRAYSANEWTYLHSRDRIKAIYRELKRIEAEHARAIGFQPRRRKRQTWIDLEGGDA